VQLKEVWLASKNIIYKNDFSAKHNTQLLVNEHTHHYPHFISLPTSLKTHLF
jgi:hypothetical protein